jgi:large subunit ribosomal protein L4
MNIEIKDTSGSVVGSIDLDDAVWGEDINEHLLWEAVKWQRAKARAGTHSTRTVAMVRGTNKKPYRQKGTGNARQGTTRGHHHVGGGRAFGPKPRDYEYTLPRKVKKKALRVALSLRAKEGKVVVLDAFALDQLAAPVSKKGKSERPRWTARVVDTLKKLGADKALVVDTAKNELLSRGAKNLKRAKFLAHEGLNVYDILDHDTLIITQESAKAVSEALKP